MSKRVVWISVARRRVSTERNRSPSSTPPPASAAYIRASERAVKQPLIAGIALSDPARRRDQPVGFRHHERFDRGPEPRVAHGSARVALGSLGVAELHEEIG